ncbi:MAG: triose-phosphate isomerase [Deltaproteobacteria bacterium]|nr:triose-phosphate isomerase [Deltaproteobacteria bacterium]MBW1874854.1 triose-phosphate isomerase [Deltaproteobacteria bacterium]MBW2209585.1 triose-phosphate isomerase [Deltaproteobacteria bacterium]MBW2213431.1 triose-phosphate isomerase [Deltaproteobacteria bacterium]MBW2379429.1 triose-phosphate isomerase [Deltaproteobacteria bacterium]
MTDRKPLIAGNWKLHNTVAESQALAGAIAAHVGDGSACEVVLGPVATSLAAVKEALGGSAVGLAAQNTHWEDSGAWTGELSPALLLDVGCGYCIIGHSERRQFFGETDAGVRKKLAALLVHKIVPILCVGESLEQREAGKTLEVVLGQVEAATEGLDAVALAPLVVAYEPIWAIGTGRTAKAEDAQEVHRAIREHLAELKGKSWADSVRVLYGGSVKPNNAEELLSQPDVDGALVGGASLTADNFIPIIDAGIGRAES